MTTPETNPDAWIPGRTVLKSIQYGYLVLFRGGKAKTVFSGTCLTDGIYPKGDSCDGWVANCFTHAFTIPAPGEECTKEQYEAAKAVGMGFEVEWSRGPINSSWNTMMMAHMPAGPWPYGFRYRRAPEPELSDPAGAADPLGEGSFVSSGKYSLVLNRKLEALPPSAKREVADALKILADHGVLNDGSDLETDFFVMYLRDHYAPKALDAYASEASLHGDEALAEKVKSLFMRSMRHPSSRRPN